MTTPTGAPQIVTPMVNSDWEQSFSTGTGADPTGEAQYQPAGNGSCVHPPTQYLPAREGDFLSYFADAQLTHPFSRDDNIEMLAASLTHDISTPRRLIGGRCRKWKVSPWPTNGDAPHSSPTVNHDCNSGATATLIVLLSMLSTSKV